MTWLRLIFSDTHTYREKLYICIKQKIRIRMGTASEIQQKQSSGFVTFTEEIFIKDYRVTSSILSKATQRTIDILKERSEAR